MKEEKNTNKSISVLTKEGEKMEEKETKKKKIKETKNISKNQKFKQIKPVKNKEKKEVENTIKEMKEKPKNKKKKIIVASVIIGILLLIGLLFSTIFALINMNNSKIISGVAIEGIDVSGL